MNHECPIDGCQQLVPPHKLMCASHWRKVPRKLQGDVYVAYNAGKGQGTEEHSQACQAAVDAVHAALGEQR